MSTSIVTQLTGEPAIDLVYQRFAVITVREDDVEDRLRKALAHVSMSSLNADDGTGFVPDDVELRASIASELKAEGLQMTGLQVCGFAWLGE